MDGDGDVDLVVANGRHWAGENRIHLNDGAGGIAGAIAFGTGADRSYTARVADFDGDGRPATWWSETTPET